MARVVSEGVVKVRFCPTIANKNAPTVAELNAGTNLTPILPKDGVNFGTTNGNMVDTGSLDTAFDSQETGSYGVSGSLTGFRDNAADTFYDLFTRGTRGFVVIGRFGLTPAAGEKVEVYPVAAQEPSHPATTPNERQTVTVDFAVTAEPAKRATVAA